MGPDARYLCRLDTGVASGNDEAKRLYCVVRTARDGGHQSCAVSRTPASACQGQVKVYRFSGEVLPESVKSAIARHRERSLPGGAQRPPQSPAEHKTTEPETVLEMTGRAREAVRNAATGAGRALGTAGKKASKGVSQSAKKTGSAVSQAARATFECLKSLFRNCGASKSGSAP
ncbi:MAG: hypothetical protein D6773_05400 [Alphaproteobacteria bacterium]|nr:MAG: hypothetical protein D6773_05400 [Alphaproteobacteria bacterium]